MCVLEPLAKRTQQTTKPAPLKPNCLAPYCNPVINQHLHLMQEIL